ncbi:MAG TPA: helix-hairpin-helix domain-containing protein [Thermoleophilaceae bacterium]|nr:helix-hairpin-helix domain-containing protein [Thermoleophilaceae bacterium]
MPEERSKWQMVAWAAAAALLVVAGVRMLGPSLGGTAEPPLVTIDGDRAGGSGRDGGGGAPGGGTGLYVHVAGAVRRPGLYRVPDDSRVAAAVAKAGGPLRRAEMTAVNLAQPLEDGQQVIVPVAAGVPGAGGAPVAGGAPEPGAPGSVPISLATVTAEQLDELDGIGPTLAERIIEFRDENGGFRSVGQLQEVEGIGEKRFAALKEAVRP